MASNEYSLKKLVLINSANYERAEIPLDDSVSIIGPNNAGKTSLINALQFLLVKDAGKMDFGAYDLNASRKFYFPGNSSYILLEMQLPVSGVVVVGCVGKGLSNDYQYFSYAGSLNIEYFKNADGSIVEEPKLREVFSERGLVVSYYRRPTEFFESLYGRHDVASKDIDIRLFSLSNGNLKDVFQKVLIKTLKLERLVAADVKNFLLQINNASYAKDVDFNKVWHEAFDPVKADKDQFNACKRMLPKIQELDKRYDRVRFLRGKVGIMRQRINEALAEWDTYKTYTEVDYKRQENGIVKRKNELRDRYGELSANDANIKSQLASLKKDDYRQEELANHFALSADSTILKQRVAHLENAVAEKQSSLNSAEKVNPRYIRNQFEDATKSVGRLQKELEAGDKLFKRKIQALLSTDEMDLLNGLSNSNILDYDADAIGDIQEFANWFKMEICNQGENISYNGLLLKKSILSLPYRGKSSEEIVEELEASKQECNRLQAQLTLLDNLEKGRQELNALRNDLSNAQCELNAFEELENLRKNEAERKAQEESLKDQLSKNEDERKQNQEEEECLDSLKSELNDKQKELNKQDSEISKNKQKRLDLQTGFDIVLDLPHDEYFCEGSIVDCLNDKMQDQYNDCSELISSGRRIKEILGDLISNGFTKYQGQDTEDEQIIKIVNFSNSLEKEDLAIQNDMRTAIVRVSSELRELSSKYENFELELQEFNALVRKRKVSDLEKLSVEIVPDQLLDAVKTFVQFSKDENENPSLFDLSTANDASGNDEIDKAKNILLRFCETNGCLRLENLFNLSFNVCKKGGKLQTFTDLAQIGSNGTVLMAKLIFGLALLFKMSSQNKRVTSVCYLDEAASIDDENQKNLIATAREFGFNLLFASPTPQNTVRYCVSIAKRNGKNVITPKQWQIFEELKPAVNNLVERSA